MNSIDMFVGAGGLALGAANAGFHHQLLLDNNPVSCRTLRANKSAGLEPFSGWEVTEGDVRSFDFAQVPAGLDLLTAGPPCQPFSTGGRHLAYRDERDLFGEVVRAIRGTQPKIFLIENVKGLVRGSFATYFEYLRLRLCHPELTANREETWVEHLARLEEYESCGANVGLNYRVLYRVLDAADYGVPQRRERVFIVGIRSDLTLDWHFPAATHSRAALQWTQRSGGEYWQKHGLANRRPLSNEKPLFGAEVAISALPWITVRDALADLPNPETISALLFPHHQFRPGAKVYKGHTGSALDEPSKALKAGVHGTAGGENMMRLDDGSVRYFTVREAARLQTFPDEMRFEGTYTQTIKQIGNGVPAKLAEVIISSLASKLAEIKIPRLKLVTGRP